MYFCDPAFHITFPHFYAQFELYVFNPQVLAFYSGTSEKEKRGEIPIDGQCRVEIIPDSHSKSPLKTPGSKHHSKFQLFASQKTYEFQANDHRTRLQWVNAFKVRALYYKRSVNLNTFCFFIRQKML